MSLKYNLPTVPNDRHISDDMIQLTRAHFSIVETFLDSISSLVESALLTGSAAWGAYYAVTSTSDIDILIVCEKTEDIEIVINKLISDKLINELESKRIKSFKKLYLEGEAESFSLIAKHNDVPVSLDFITSEILEKICNLEQMGAIVVSKEPELIELRTIKEFRVNKPKEYGYSADDLKGVKHVTYHPNYKKVEDENEMLGYLADILIDGQAAVRGEPTYLLGVIAFFLSIGPIILVDKNQRLEKAVNAFRGKIKQILNGEVPLFITRQQQMTEDKLRLIKDELSSGKNA